MNQARQSVENFAKAMEETLKDNDHKGGWDMMPRKELFLRLHEEMMEVDCSYYPPMDHQRLKKELTDVANFCMMLWETL